MPVTTSSAGTTITGESIAHFHVMRVISALSMEVSTGMKFSNRGSILTVAKNLGLTTKRTKKGALIDAVAWAEKNIPNYEVPARVKKALES